MASASSGVAPSSSWSSTSANSTSESLVPSIAIARASETRRRSASPIGPRYALTKPFSENSHGPAVKGALPVATIGDGGVALRTAATRAPACTTSATERKDRSVHIGDAVR